MNNEPMTLKEFAAIMTAAAIITTALVSTYQPAGRGVPIYLGQASGIQMSSGDRPMDLTKDSVWAANQFNTERVAPPYTQNQGWSCSIGSAWSSAIGALGSFFGGMGRWLNPESPY